MHLTAFTPILFAVLATAVAVLPRDSQLDTTGLTACGFQCYQQNVALATTCDPADMLCLCINDAFHGGMLPCLTNTCEYKDLLNTFNWVGNGCRKAVAVAEKKADAEVRAALKTAQEAQKAKKKAGAH